MIDRRLAGAAGGAVRGWTAVCAVLGTLSAVAVIGQAWALASLVGSGFGGRSGSGLGPGAWLGLLAVCVVARAAIAWATEAAAFRAAASVKSTLRLRLASHAMALGPRWLGTRKTASLVTLATRGVDGLDDYFARYLPQVMLSATVPVAVLAVLFGVDWESGLIVLVTLPLIPLFLWLVGVATRTSVERRRRALDVLAGHFLDVVAGLPDLLVFGRARAQAAAIRRATDEDRAATLRTLRLAFLSSLVLELASTIAVAMVAVGIGLRLVAGTLDLRTGLLVLILAPEAYWPLRQVGAFYHASAEGKAAADEVVGVLSVPLAAAVPFPLPGQRAEVLDAGIDIRSLTVRYPGRTSPAVADFSLTVAPGECVALVGPSGAGKSTVLKALLGFVEAESGIATVSGPVAWLPQHPYLFAGTVAENVRLSRADAPDAAVWAALRAAAAADFVAALPGGLSARIGEGGHGLSAGQRQRLGLARAFLADRPVVLLDEPTASLDPAAEAEVVRSMRRLIAGRTAIVVAHRAALVEAADRVVVVGGGSGWRSPKGAEAATGAHRTAVAQIGEPETTAELALADRSAGDERADSEPPPATNLASCGAATCVSGPRCLEVHAAEPEAADQPAATCVSGSGAARCLEGHAAVLASADQPAGRSAVTCVSGSGAARCLEGHAAEPEAADQPTAAPRAADLAATRHPTSRLAFAAALGAAALGCAAGLAATSAWLISRAAQQPPIFELMVAITAVRALGIGRAVFRYAERLVAHDAAYRILGALRARTYDRLWRQAPGRRRGELLARFVADVDAVQDRYVRFLIPASAAAAVGTVAVGALATVLPSVAVITGIGLLATGVAIPVAAARISANADRNLAPAKGRLIVELHDLLRGAPDLIAADAVPRRLARVHAADRDVTGVERRAAKARSVGAALTTLATGATVWAAAYASLRALHESRGASGGETLPVTLLAVLILTPLALFEATATLPQALQHRRRAKAAERRVREVLAAPDAVQEPAEPRELPKTDEPPTIRIRALKVTWPGRRNPALHHLDLDLTPGRKIAVVGPSGSGKTTLISTLLRFVEPATPEAITLGGVPLADLRAEDVRRVIGLCAQDAHVFDSTLRENLRLARPQATDAELEEALTRARLADWVRTLPAGLDTFVGEHGARLSGGQHRRLVLARALLADFPVLLLDEPTEHLDPATADALLGDLLALPKTVLLATHRLAGLEHVDEIVVLDGGRVVERGTWPELMRKRGAFHSLCRVYA